MTQPQKSVAKGKSEPDTKVVVFGVDGKNWRPHAAWFPQTEAGQAHAAAKQLRFNVIDVANGHAADVVGKLPAGQINAAGPGVVPPIREDLYEKIVATINSRGEAGQEPGEPIVTQLPETWAAIKPGHLVLIQDSLIGGWYEAIVVGRTGDKLTLRWRDYPGWPKVNVRASAVALVSSVGS